MRCLYVADIIVGEDTVDQVHGSQSQKRFGRICSEVCVWMDRQYSSLALDHWLRELQTICVLQSCSNECQTYVKWRYVRTEQNPAAVGSRGTLSRQALEIWMKGPNWLSKPEMWWCKLGQVNREKQRPSQ